jgi:hypothetical protein
MAIPVCLQVRKLSLAPVNAREDANRARWLY